MKTFVFQNNIVAKRNTIYAKFGVSGVFKLMPNEHLELMKNKNVAVLIKDASMHSVGQKCMAIKILEKGDNSKGIEPILDLYSTCIVEIESIVNTTVEEIQKLPKMPIIGTLKTKNLQNFLQLKYPNILETPQQQISVLNLRVIQRHPV